MNLQKFLLLAAAAVLTAAFGQHYFRNNTKKEKQVLVFKALATAMPVMLAFLYALTAQEVHRTLSLMILAGAFLCMTADVLLELYFLSGVVSFGLGHVCFIAAYMHLTQFSRIHGADISAVLFAHAFASWEISAAARLADDTYDRLCGASFRHVGDGCDGGGSAGQPGRVSDGSRRNLFFIYPIIFWASACCTKRNPVF